ncbi:MAG: hypothetical protein DMF58_01750 [Acidobacteria bacterium]|nr:MAG: hypothetical protein DMF58_01750 [Acidobacteriota bacterium]
MSLRIFHIIFVTVSIALSVFVTIWGVREYALTRSNGALILAGVFLICGVVLVFYAGRVFRKLREL